MLHIGILRPHQRPTGRLTCERPFVEHECDWCETKTSTEPVVCGEHVFHFCGGADSSCMIHAQRHGMLM